MKKNSLINSLLGTLTTFSFDDHAASGSEAKDASSNELTGVARYLDKMPSATSVDKYLKSHKHDPATGVAKYMAKQILSVGNRPASTGVSKYITRQILSEKEKPAASSVARYLARQSIINREKPVATGVANYLSRLAKDEKANLPTTGVGRYLYEIEKAARKAAAAELVAKCIEAEAQAALLAAQTQSESPEAPEVQDEFDPAATGVSQYLAKQGSANKRTATGVAKYMAKRVSVSGSAPAKTGVAKYLAKQASIVKETPTGVARYLTRQILVERVVDTSTGVDKYVDRIEHSVNERPKMSGVTKYLARQSVSARYAQAESSAKREEQKVAEDDVEPLEASVQESQSVAQELTGVARYLAEKASTELAIPSKPMTGVERYLRNKV